MSGDAARLVPSGSGKSDVTAAVVAMQQQMDAQLALSRMLTENLTGMLDQATTLRHMLESALGKASGDSGDHSGRAQLTSSSAAGMGSTGATCISSKQRKRSLSSGDGDIPTHSVQLNASPDAANRRLRMYQDQSECVPQASAALPFSPLHLPQPLWQQGDIAQVQSPPKPAASTHQRPHVQHLHKRAPLHQLLLMQPSTLPLCIQPPEVSAPNLDTVTRSLTSSAAGATTSAEPSRQRQMGMVSSGAADAGDGATGGSRSAGAGGGIAAGMGSGVGCLLASSTPRDGFILGARTHAPTAPDVISPLAAPRTAARGSDRVVGRGHDSSQMESLVAAAAAVADTAAAAVDATATAEALAAAQAVSRGGEAACGSAGDLGWTAAVPARLSWRSGSLTPFGAPQGGLPSVRSHNRCGGVPPLPAGEVQPGVVAQGQTRSPGARHADVEARVSYGSGAAGAKASDGRDGIWTEPPSAVVGKLSVDQRRQQHVQQGQLQDDELLQSLQLQQQQHQQQRQQEKWLQLRARQQQLQRELLQCQYEEQQLQQQESLRERQQQLEVLKQRLLQHQQQQQQQQRRQQR